MHPPTTIARVAALPLTVPLTRSFGIAGGAQDEARNVLVQVVLEDGTEGIGESAPFPAVSGETQESTQLCVEALEGILVGEDARAWRRLAARMGAEANEAPAARCGLEVAILDALLSRARLGMHAFFGGVDARLDTWMTITTGTVEQAREETRDVLGRGISKLKVKVGGGAFELDVERVRAVRAEAPAARILLDGNEAFDAAGAVALVAELRRAGIEIALFEQPTPAADLDALSRVAAEGRVPVCADESVRSSADAFRVARAGAAQVVNLKLTKLGVAEALDALGVLRAAGLEVMVGAMVESRLGIAASAAFAAGAGGVEWVDLDTAMFLREDPFRGGYAQEGGTLVLEEAVAGGHGVSRRDGN